MKASVQIMFRQWTFMIVIIVITPAPCTFAQSYSDKYGPFKVRWKSYELCNGPKRQNLTLITKSLLVENDVYKGLMNLTFFENTQIDEIKISVVANSDSKTNPITWNYKIQKPCQHYAIAWALNQYLEATNCLVKKGAYYTAVDFTEATTRFFAGKFFYGEYMFKLLVLSNKGNIACVIFHPVFTKE